MHHAHHIIQRARHHVRRQRQESEMGKHSTAADVAADKAAVARTAELHAAAVAKGKQAAAQTEATRGGSKA